MSKPGKCAIWNHPDNAEINRRLAEKALLREISERYGMNISSVSRHRSTCIPAMMVKADANDAISSSIVIEKSLEKTFAHINKLIDACDEWLLDPGGSGRYSLDPRGYELDVVYDDHNDTDERGKPRRKKESLQSLLTRIEAGSVTVDIVESKYADPRKLIIESATEIRAHLDFYARLHGLYQKERTNQIEEEERKRFFAEQVREIMREFGVDEKGAISWVIEELPELSDLVTKYRM